MKAAELEERIDKLEYRMGAICTVGVDLDERLTSLEKMSASRALTLHERIDALSLRCGVTT